MKKILLVEDDETVGNIILYYLGNNPTYRVNWAKNASEAIAEAGKKPDIILLDICLPDVNGVTLCRKLRETLYCPIIFISCLDDEETIIKALETGGDDYLTKPFSGKMLEAHIEANLRRIKIERDRDRAAEEKGMISFEDFVIDRDTHSLIRAGVTYHLAPIEYAILMYFISTPGKIISPDDLYEIIWEKPGYGDVRTVVTHVYNLRKIVEPDISNPKYIINVRGYGYCFHPIGVLTST